MDKTLYKRNCPICGKELSYCRKSFWENANKINSKCNSCANRIISTNRIRPLLFVAKTHHTEESKKKMSLANIGKSHGPCSEERRLKLLGKKQSAETCLKKSIFQNKRYSNPEERKRSSELAKKILSRPEVKRKLRDSASNQPRRFGKAVDKGQVELINKWNKLGFNFDINYKLHTNDVLYFLDGYDKKRNVVLEYDSKYHNTARQSVRDLIRQNNIINILKPNKFWRYDAVNKQCKNILEKA